MLGRSVNITAAELRVACARDLLEKSDEEITAAGVPQANAAVAKMALVVSVMEEFQMQPFRYYESVGTTMGMVGVESFWGK